MLRNRNIHTLLVGIEMEVASSEDSLTIHPMDQVYTFDP